MQQEITNYINTNFIELQQIVKNITRNNELGDDLLQEIIIQLYEKKEIVLHNYEDDTIKYYLIKIIKINWHSKTSPFHYRIRKESQKYSELTYQHLNYSDTDKEEIIEYEELITNVEREFSELNWFSKRLFELYLTLGSLKKVSNQTQIPIASVGRYIREIKQEIKQNINEKKDKSNYN